MSNAPTNIRNFECVIRLGNKGFLALINFFTDVTPSTVLDSFIWNCKADRAQRFAFLIIPSKGRACAFQ